MARILQAAQNVEDALGTHLNSRREGAKEMQVQERSREKL